MLMYIHGKSNCRGGISAWYVPHEAAWSKEVLYTHTCTMDNGQETLCIKKVHHCLIQS